MIPQKSEFKAIMRADFPNFEDKLSFPAEANEMELVFETIKSLRNVRQSFNIPMNVNFNITVHAPKDEKTVFEAIESYIRRMAKVEQITYSDDMSPSAEKSATAVVSASKIVIPLENLIDFNEEIARQEKKLGKLQNERKSLEGRINNPKFVANAPSELIKQTKERIEEIVVQETAINDLISSLKS